MPTTWFRTPFSARSGRGTRTCPGATVGAGCSPSAETCFSARASGRGPWWSWSPASSISLWSARSTTKARATASTSIFSRLDLAPAIAAALATVPEPFRSTLVIVDVEDQSYESAAEILRRPDRDGALASVPRASADAGAADDLRARRGLRVSPRAPHRSAPNRLSRSSPARHQVAATRLPDLLLNRIAPSRR